MIDLETYCAARVALARCRLEDEKRGILDPRWQIAYDALKHSLAAAHDGEMPALLRRQAG